MPGASSVDGFFAPITASQLGAFSYVGVESVRHHHEDFCPFRIKTPDWVATGW